MKCIALLQTLVQGELNLLEEWTGLPRLVRQYSTLRATSMQRVPRVTAVFLLGYSAAITAIDVEIVPAEKIRSYTTISVCINKRD